MMNIISALDLEVSFGNKRILKCINIDVRQGESLVIIGESGSGKSLFIKTIIGLVNPSKGEIIVRGVSAKKRRNYIKDFGVLFQGCALFDSLTVGENITFNFDKRFNINKKDARELSIEKLEMVGLSEEIVDMYPTELSGGMKKRVGLARAIAGNPQMIILDEPTSGLDPIMSDVVSEIVIKCRDKFKLTTLTITHDIYNAFKIADSIAVLYRGEIIFHGSVQDMISSNDKYIKSFLRHSYC